jgi:UDP-N-acetyl-D-mannosaminuronic acid dehydrogenase
MQVSLIGLGYIGLPTAALIASRGVKVSGVDINPEIVKIINEGKIHIVEPNLDKLVQNSVENGNLKAMTIVEKADVFIISVPTPFKENHKPDISYIEFATKNIAPNLDKGNLVILESTSPVGTTEKIAEWIKEVRPDLILPEFGNETICDINIAHCPERVLPGNILFELVKNDRIIGGISSECARKAINFYKIFVEGDCLITDSRTAELCKLVENSFRDVNIAFANELSLICDKLNINVWELINLANRHPRVSILQPGPGVGGHCIAVDPWFIVDSSPDEAKMIKLARKINDEKPNFILKKINDVIANSGKDAAELSIACLGLSFKPDIDDLRESPALEISKRINMIGFKRQYVVEPNISCLPSDLDIHSTRLEELEKAIINSDIIVLLVDHTSFKNINLSLLSGKKIIDTRGVWSVR